MQSTTLVTLITLLTACASSPTPTQRAAEAVQTREPSLREQADTLAKTDRNAAHVLYAQLCDEGDGASCLRAADTLSPALVVERANFRARSCDLGDQSGCFKHAFDHWYGRGVDMNLERALALQLQACDNGVSVACDRAADWANQLATREVDELMEANVRRNAFDVANAVMLANAYDQCVPDGDIPGSFMLRYQVDGNGAITNVTIEPEHPNTQTGACLTHSLTDTRLPDGFEGKHAAAWIR